MADPQQVRAHFDGVASSYSDDSAGGLWSLARRAESRAVMELLAPEAGEAVLDAGSGAGYYSGLLAGRGCNVTALDLSGQMLAALRSRLKIETIEGNIERDAPEARFDRVLCAGALEFVGDPQAAVLALKRALRPVGPRVVVVLLPRAGLASRCYRLYHRLHKFQVHLFSRADVARLASGAGLAVVEARPVTFNWVCRMVPT